MSTSVSSQASLELLGGLDRVCIRLTLVLASTWENLSVDKGQLEMCTSAYNTWDITEPNANSNLQEHKVERGEVDKRRDQGSEQGFGTK